MRKSSILATLFPRTRQRLLAAMFGQPGKWWYLSELAQYLRTRPSSLQRELRAMAASGILQKRREGTRTYFKAETGSPIFPELHGLIEKTAGLIPTLQGAVETFHDQIDCAFVYGSVARGEEHALSDVDLIVVGRVGLAELAPAIRKAEARLGRDVNVISYSVGEFCERVAARDHFVVTVLNAPKQFIKGDQRDLDNVTGRKRHPAA
jgi:predicted nucleotidyltransferase